MPSSAERVTLDEVRDFLYTGLRSIERFSTELKAFVEGLDKKQASDEWLEESQAQLHKGAQFMEQQQHLWDLELNRMEAYIASVRALADELAMKDLSLSKQEGEEEDAQDARIIHPELRRFKLEKTARIVGKYGGSPALGAMIMPRLTKESILKATGSPAAREIQYSKQEGKDAMYLAEVMRFKREKKDAELEGWQKELVGKKGETYLQEQQAKGLQPETSPHTPVLPKDLAEKLAARQAMIDAEEQQKAAAAAAANAKKASPPALTGELADRFKRRQQAEDDAKAAASAAEAEAALAAKEAAEVEADRAAAQAGAAPATPQLPAGAPPMAAVNQQLSGVLKARRVDAAAKAAEQAGGSSQAQQDSETTTPAPWATAKLKARTPSATTPPAGGVSAAGAATSELMARFQKLRKDDENAS